MRKQRTWNEVLVPLPTTASASTQNHGKSDEDVQSVQIDANTPATFIEHH